MIREEVEASIAALALPKDVDEHASAPGIRMGVIVRSKAIMSVQVGCGFIPGAVRIRVAEREDGYPGRMWIVWEGPHEKIQAGWDWVWAAVVIRP